MDRQISNKAARSLSTPSLPTIRRRCKIHLLVAASGPRDVSWARNVVVRLCKDPRIEMRAVVDEIVPRLSQTVMVMQNGDTIAPVDINHNGSEGDAASTAALTNRVATHPSTAAADDAEFYRQQAFELVDWADMLVLAPLDADGIGKMLSGTADTLLLELLRGWDTTKRILMVPGMSTHMFDNPMTKRHLDKIRRKWPWIRTFPPILWHYEGGPVHPKRVVTWDGFNELLGVVSNQAELFCLGQDSGLGGHSDLLHTHMLPDCSGEVVSRLPPEIWTIILEHVGDWELAKALGIYTTLPMPENWTLQPSDPKDPLKVYQHELEWTVLTGSSNTICKKISQSPPEFRDLPTLVVKLIIRFALVEVLQYLEANRPSLFRAFEGRILSTWASAFWPNTQILDFWKNSAWFNKETKGSMISEQHNSANSGVINNNSNRNNINTNTDSNNYNINTNNDNNITNGSSFNNPISNKLLQSYDNNAVDWASMNGHVRALEWWLQSGLPLRYTEAALEQASGKGHLQVLAWWRDAAAQDERVILRPGRSLLLAAQHGQVEVLRWWHSSGIPVSHGDGVAKMASRWGQVQVLEQWRRQVGDDNMAFDADVLVTPTIHQHIGVLEWWRGFARGTHPGMEHRGHRVEYRTCNIEEALEDSIGDQKRVRRWWSENGLNLGLRNMEWIETRCL